MRRRGDDASAVAAAALYVLEVTRANAQWAAWAERDTAFVRWGYMQPTCQTQPILVQVLRCGWIWGWDA